MLTLHSRICPDPATLTAGQRRNKRYPSGEQVRDFLRAVNEQRANPKSCTDIHSAAYFPANNNGLIRFERDVWLDGAKFTRHTLTQRGAEYLRWLEAKLCVAIIPHGYDARFDALSHWIENKLWNEWVSDRAAAESLPLPF